MKKNLVFIIIVLLLLSGCQSKGIYEKNYFAFDTVIDLKIYEGGSEKILKELEEEIYRLEEVFSIHDESSQISKLPNIEDAEGDLASIISLSLEMEELTGGSFDPFLGRVSALWAFGSPEENIPEASLISAALEESKNRNIEDLDFGGIAKGYAADRLLQMAKDRGVKSALFNLGGNIITLGTYEGRSFNIGIQDPLDKAGAILGVVKMKENSAVTSGDYQRGFDKDGVRYHHILDPENGYPVQKDLMSVSVILPNSARADAYSTALFVMGFEEARTYALDNGVPVVLVNRDGEVLVLNDNDFEFELRNEDYRLVD
ncbi:MAG: FAD:protein FMN transferase [Tissierellia bacterium]|nr:FAD:protein FMN transferase [Tissierellia bacterium]